MLSFRNRTERARTRRWRSVLEMLEDRVTPTTFHVNTFLDTVAVNLKTGRDASGHVSLRSAIMAADANPKSSDTIILPAGTYNLTIAPTGDDGPSSGDLDILVDNKLTIEGSKNGGQTIIDGHNLDRVFLTINGRVAMSNLVIEHGESAFQGGGLLNDGATDTLTSVQFLDDFVNGQNGANGAFGTTDGSVGTNGQAGGAGTNVQGGAICNLGPSLTITSCVFNGNAAVGGNGGIGGNGGFGGGANRSADFVGLSGEGGAGGAGGIGGAAQGGAVFNGPHASLILSGDSFLQNEALGGNGGSGGQGNIGQGGAGPNDNGGGAGIGGSAAGGPGGAGGIGGPGAGGGIFNSTGTITFERSTTGFSVNDAIGGQGGAGGGGDNGVGGSGGNALSGGPGGGTGDGGVAGGDGGAGGLGGEGLGGAIFNARNGSISSTVALALSSNSAIGGQGGAGEVGGAAFAGSGGNGGGNSDGPAGSGGDGASASGGTGGAGGTGGVGEGGGIFNSVLASITFTAGKNRSAPAATTFSANKAEGGNGGHGGAGGDATAGSGGNGGTPGAFGTGGNAGSATSGSGGSGGAGGLGSGGGFYDDGTASLTGITVNFTNNAAVGGSGGNGFTAGNAFGGSGGNGEAGKGGNGGDASGGNGGNAGVAGVGSGGGITVDTAGSLVLKPRLGARKGSKQANATDIITLNSAIPGQDGIAGSAPGSVTPGARGPGNPPGAAGALTPGQFGALPGPRRSVGGGIAIFGKATADNTSVTGNNAILFPNIDGTLST